MKADTQIEPLFRPRTHRKKKKGKKTTWHDTMFLTHNAMNVSWPEPWRMTFTGIRRFSDALPHQRLEPHGKTDPLETRSTMPEGPSSQWAHFALCVKMGWGGVGVGGLTKLHGSLHSRNSWIKPYSVLHAVVSLSPSLIAVITDSAPIEVWQTERQMSLHADRQSCAVHQSSTLLPRYESAGLTINSVPWVQWLLPYSDRLARAASPSLHHKYTRRSSY